MMRSLRRPLVLAVIGALFAVACSAPERRDSLNGETRPDPRSVFDPVEAGEELPDGYRPVFPRDAIRPIYDPEFVSASEIDWRDEALIIGMELDGEAKAYPVLTLNRREIVVDRLAGIPILVTW